MSTFFITFGVFMLVILAMAVGVIVRNQAIKGSCGGLNDIEGLEGACAICAGRHKCRRKRAQRKALTAEN